MKKSGFTLIELMIVVVIIGMLAAFVIPAFLSLSDKSGDVGKKLPGKQGLAAKSSEAAIPVQKPEPRPAVIPETMSADIRVDLKATHFIRKMKVYTLFDAGFRGRYVFKNPDPANPRIKLHFPFPKGTAQAWDAVLKIRMNTDAGNADSEYKGLLAEPDQVIYNLSGITWFGNLFGNQTLDADVVYKAQGYDRYVYTGPGSGRAGRLKLEMTLDGLTGELIPADALQPAQTTSGRLVWEFDNLITDRKIMVELPGAMSPTGRVILFLRLAGFAVFFFGLGFIYLNDLIQPGRHDNFRWGHFLLLALTYCLFFLIFTVLHLGPDLNPYLSLAVSAAVSLPLLMIHVSRFWGRHFALTRILPLSLFTLAIVINGVYGQRIKTYVFLALIVSAAAFITITYTTWSDKKKQYKEEKARQDAEKQQEQTLKIKQEKENLEKRDAREKRLNSIKKSFDRIRGQLHQAKRQIRKSSALMDYDFKTHEPLKDFIRKQTDSLDEFQTGYNTTYARLKSLIDEKIDDEDADNFDDTCTDLEKESDLLNEQIGEMERQISESVQTLYRAREREKSPVSGKEDMIHCMACGAEIILSNFCPACGVKSPVRRICAGCGEPQMLQVHLMGRRKKETQVHCMACGHLFPEIENTLNP